MSPTRYCIRDLHTCANVILKGITQMSSPPSPQHFREGRSLDERAIRSKPGSPSRSNRGTVKHHAFTEDSTSVEARSIQWDACMANLNVCENAC